MSSLIDRELKEAEKSFKNEELRTQTFKGGFINEIKNGLGEEIKKTGNKVILIKKKRRTQLSYFLKDYLNYFEYDL